MLVGKDGLRRAPPAWWGECSAVGAGGRDFTCGQYRAGAGVVFSHSSTWEEGGTQGDCPGSQGPPPVMLGFRHWT